MKTLLVALVLFASQFAHAGDTVPISDSGWSTCRAGVTGCRKLSDYTAKREAALTCQRHGGIPVSQARITSSDCEFNAYVGRKQCQSIAEVNCYLR